MRKQKPPQDERQPTSVYTTSRSPAVECVSLEVNLRDKISPGFMYKISSVPSPQCRSARRGARAIGDIASETRTPGRLPRVLEKNKIKQKKQITIFNLRELLLWPMRKNIRNYHYQPTPPTHTHWSARSNICRTSSDVRVDGSWVLERQGKTNSLLLFWL